MPELIGSGGKDCPMCHLPPERIIARHEGALLITRTTKEGMVVPNEFHVIPEEHIYSERFLPTGCTSGKWRLLEELPPEVRKLPRQQYVNEGWRAGQRLEHWHLWVWPVLKGEERVGLRTTHDRMLAAEAEVAKLSPMVSGMQLNNSAFRGTH